MEGLNREINEITDFQANSIKSWQTDSAKMKEFQSKDDESAKVMKDFYTGKITAHRTNRSRVHNSLTSMRNEMRRYITYKGEQLIEIDTANSQPVLLAHELKKEGYEVEDELIRILLKGDFYSLFNGTDRDSIKEKVFSFLYAIEMNKDHEVYKVLLKKYPNFTVSLCDFSKGRSLAMLLQKAESRIWIDKVSHTLMLAGIKHATIHDSVVFANHNDLNKVLDVIYMSFNGIEPKLHIHKLDGSDVRFNRKESDVMKPFFDKAVERAWAFWYFTSKGQIGFDTERMMNFLNSTGIYRYYTSQQDYIFIRIINNLVEQIDMATIKGVLMNYVIKHADISVKRAFERQINFLASQHNMELLEPKEIPFFSDKRDEAHFFFKDAIIRVKKGCDNLQVIEYNSFEHPVWKSRIIARDCPKKNDGESEFKQFLNNVFREDASRQLIMQSIGYLLHDNRNRSFTPAIILSDNNIADDSQGGTGKGIIVQALQQFLKIAREDGKTFDPRRVFSYQNIDLDTRLLFIDDAKKHFSLEALFSMLTEGFIIEKKNKQSFELPFEQSPKVIITTNFAIKGDGESHKRRRVDNALDDHYNSERTPSKEFEHMLFSDWGTEEWERFDIFMLICVQEYLDQGVRRIPNTNLERKRLRIETHIDFEDWLDRLGRNEWHQKNELLNSWREEIIEPKFTKRKLTVWIGKYESTLKFKLDNDRKKDRCKLLT